ncbi:DUF917 domain-containing protein [Celeribacter indicus]|uniref:DUF917 domain-containing protein n=1 Tax=Celeribacter indicus TaxID=1208324 RepID=A0A0B5E0V9_9RHOB|nr:DUF917 domain-containing protein [Celeribacter indicus]AJE47050.1 hypothetical protein P73_2335 [Celeribacter indicus]SDW92121.1 hypothetical protein SAMN05443573_109101 [Celeribacter indicus]
MREFPEDDIAPLATGAWVLGTGGGGSPYHGFLNLRKLYRQGHRVNVIGAEELDDDAMVAVVSNMGAPVVGLERIADPATQVGAIRMMERFLGRRFDAIMALEIGGGNALQPFTAAALMDLPVIDADSMGRAFPEAQMTSFSVGKLQMFPLTLQDIRDNAVIVERAASWKWMERLSRKACVEVGSIAATCKAPRSGAEVKTWGIRGTVAKAVRIGRAIAAARAAHEDPVAAVVEQENGLLMFTGRVWDVERNTTEGFLRGRVELEGLQGDKGRRLSVDFQNEYTLATCDGTPLVSVPDLICLLDSVSGEAIGTEMLRYGQRVSLIALPAPPVFTSPDGLACVGPRCFGHDMDFISVFA